MVSRSISLAFEVFWGYLEAFGGFFEKLGDWKTFGGFGGFWNLWGSLASLEDFSGLGEKVSRMS